jgi:hypothetical protein
MALVLVKEDGSGLANANAYADLADAEGFHERHVNLFGWSTATDSAKETALSMATRLIDELWQFNGFRANEGQALQWPRERCPDPDKGTASSVLIWANGNYFEPNIVPKGIIEATCEMAKQLLLLDRTLIPEGEGLHSVYESSSSHAADGSGGADISSKVYDKKDKRRILTHLVEAMLSKFGAPIQSGDGMVRLIRT